MSQQKIVIKNKKASYLYELLERFTAGIELYGTEIKSIRLGKASLTDSYCKFINNELWVIMHIAEYSFGSHYNHEPKRERKLLLTKRELKKIGKKVKTSGLTVIPTRMFINEKGFAKLNVSLAKGKKMHDKRESLKKNETKRELDRMKKIR